MLLECINTSVWNLFIIPEEDWSQSKSIEEYEANKLKNEDGYSCFYAFVQLPGHSSKTIHLSNQNMKCNTDVARYKGVKCFQNKLDGEEIYAKKRELFSFLVILSP